MTLPTDIVPSSDMSTASQPASQKTYQPQPQQQSSSYQYDPMYQPHWQQQHMMKQQGGIYQQQSQQPPPPPQQPQQPQQPVTARPHKPRRPSWNNRSNYPSQGNDTKHRGYRTYFTSYETHDDTKRSTRAHPDPTVHALPTKPALKQLILRGREFYLNTRDPRFYNYQLEQAWNSRAGIVAAQHNHAIHRTHQYYDGGLDGADGEFDGTGVGSLRNGEKLPIIQQAQLEFVRTHGYDPNNSALWPQFRFDYLRKHSRAPLSPYLAAMNGYDVPPEIIGPPRQSASAPAGDGRSPPASFRTPYWRTQPVLYDETTGTWYQAPPPQQSSTPQDPLEARRRGWNSRFGMERDPIPSQIPHTHQPAGNAHSYLQPPRGGQPNASPRTARTQHHNGGDEHTSYEYQQWQIQQHQLQQQMYQQQYQQYRQQQQQMYDQQQQHYQQQQQQYEHQSQQSQQQPQQQQQKQHEETSALDKTQLRDSSESKHAYATVPGSHGPQYIPAMEFDYERNHPYYQQSSTSYVDKARVVI